METLCLDTDILIDFLRGDNTTVEKIKELEEEFVLATTTINLFELYYGAFKSKKSEKNVKSVNKLAERLELLKFTDKSAEISGRIIAELEKKGRLVDFRDAMIAGIVLENDAMLYTRNVKHFERIEGMRLYKE